MSDNEKRVEALEIKMMDLEQSMADLNDVVIRQYQLIDALKDRHNKLSHQLESMDNNAADPGKEPPPPHY